MLTATFLGTSTVLVRDGSSAVLVDGFFSRPGLLRILRGVQPNPKVIDQVLNRAGIDQLDLVAVSHSHFDHALDAPYVAGATGAALLGSVSTQMIARGVRFDENRYLLADDGVTVAAGSFRVTPILGIHSDGDVAEGTIAEPLAPPASVRAYKTGECYGFHIEHDDGAVLVHGSANFVPGAYRGRHADLVYLGAGAASKQSEEWREQYWDDVIGATGAGRVRPVHWDRFWRPLSKPLVSLPRRMDDFQATMRTWNRKAQGSGIDLSVPHAFVSEPVRP